MPEWQGHLCESPELSHLNHTDAQSPWCIRGFKLWYGLTEDGLQLEPTSITEFEKGTLTFESLIKLLHDPYYAFGGEELNRIFMMAYRLTEARGQEWLNEEYEFPETRTIDQFYCMALDTAIIWERG